MNKKKTFIASLIIPPAIFLFNLLLLFVGAYDKWPSIDIPMHFVGGASIAFLFISFISLKSNKINIKSRMLEVILIVSFVCLAAVLWEFFEFTMEAVSGYDWQSGLEDTLLDLLMGIVGGLLIGLLIDIEK